MSNTFPHNGEDSQLAREGSRQQRAEARRKIDIDATIYHYMTMLHTALAEDFNISDGDAEALVLSYYCHRALKNL